VTFQELQTKIEAKRARVREVFEETKSTDKDKPDYDFAKAKAGWLGAEIVGIEDAAEKTIRVAEAIQTETAELNELQEKLEKLDAAQKGLDKFNRDDNEPAQRVQHADGDRKERKTIGRMVTEHEHFKTWLHDGMSSWGHGKKIVLKDAGLKTLFQTSAGWAPESIRTGFVAEKITRPIQLLDILPMGNTGQAAVVYMEETTRTPGAAGTTEGAQKPESVYALTERSVTVREIADSIPVTEVQLEDVAMVESYLEGRLAFGIRQKLDEHAITQGADTDSIVGILDNVLIQDQPLGSDSLQDAILKAITLVRVNGRAMPTHVVMPSLDWQNIRLSREGAGTGLYLWGPPSESGPPRIWGLPIVLNDALPGTTGQDGKVLVGSFESPWITLFERRGIVVEQGWVNDQFRENRRTIRASGRWALVIYRPEAFATVTTPEVT
jgi:HK97 family phage major capsid protein